MAELTFEDYKQRLSIQELLVDAGYRFYRRDGLRYPAYVRYDKDGRRVHGDKFLVSGHGTCCCHPPEMRNYNIISFITEHPHFFPDYTPGMSPHRLVNLVCGRLLNVPVEEREAKVRDVPREAKPFRMEDYETVRFDPQDWESQKKFCPYFRNRGLTLATQKAFCRHFFLSTPAGKEGKRFTNLSFPLTSPLHPEQGIVGMEERSRPNAGGHTAYKGMAAGSNASEGLWMGSAAPSVDLKEVKEVYWFESALDAMAFYQLHGGDDGVKEAVLASTGGTPSKRQMEGLIAAAPQARHHLCFDNDLAGQAYAVNFRGIANRMGLAQEDVDVRLPREGFKDWNDEVMGKSSAKAPAESPGEEEKQVSHYKR